MLYNRMVEMGLAGEKLRAAITKSGGSSVTPSVELNSRQRYCDTQTTGISLDMWTI